MRAILLFVVLMILWLLLSGIFTLQLVLYGVLSCALVVAITIHVGFLDRINETIVRIPRIVAYLPWLFWQILKSNFSVLKIILDPRLPIDPRVITVPADQRSEVGQVIYANSITLTPGTLTLDLRDGKVLVHALTPESAAEVEGGEMNRRVARLDGKASSPEGSESA